MNYSKVIFYDTDIKKSLMEISDRFTEGNTLLGDGVVKGLKRNDAKNKIKELTAVRNEDENYNNIIFFHDNAYDHIWALNPVKMALLLHMHEEVISLLDNNYPLEYEEDKSMQINLQLFEEFSCSDNVMGLTEPDGYDCTMPESHNKVKILCPHRYISAIALILADESMPDELLQRLLPLIKYESQNKQEWIETIEKNPVEGRINTEWLYKVCRLMEEEDLIKYLQKYAFYNDGKHISVDRENNYYIFKAELILQLLLAQRMIERKEYRKLLKSILAYKCNVIEFEIGLNPYRDKYLYDYKFDVEKKLTLLTKQRRKLLEICKDNNKLQEAVSLKVLEEVNCLRHNEMSKFESVSKAIDNYEGILKKYHDIKWENLDVQMIINHLFSKDIKVSSSYIRDIRRLTGLDLEFCTTDNSINVLNMILGKFCSRRLTSERDYTEQMDLYAKIEEFCGYFKDIRWRVRDSWLIKSNQKVYDNFKLLLAEIDDENLYKTVIINGLVIKSELPKLIDLLIENKKYKNIPLLIAHSGTK